MQSTSSELDLRAFNNLFNEYWQRFVRFATTYVNDVAVAEDIVMESFEGAWENRDRLSVTTFPAYTLTTVKHKSLNHLRSKNIKIRVNESILSHSSRLLEARISTLEACDPEELFNDEARRLVNETLAKLPGHTRDIFVDSRFNGLSYKEISAIKGVTVKSVEFEVSKAMKALRISLKDYLPALIFLLMFVYPPPLPFV